MKKPNQPLTVDLECVDVKSFVSLFSFCFDFPRADMYFRMLMDCALSNDSIESYCNKNDESPDRLQYYMKRISVEEVVEFGVRAFEKTLRMYDHEKVLLAIDFHDREYYGEAGDHVINTVMLHGERFCKALVHRYITVSIVDKGFKHTLAILPVMNPWKHDELVERLLRIAEKKVEVECVLFDREFLGMGVLETVDNIGIQYLIPAKKGNGDIRVAYWASLETGRWRWPHRVYKDRKTYVETELFLREVYTTEYMGFLTNRYMKSDTFEALLGMYDLRWNIENGYKEAKSYLIRTSSKNPAYRLLILVVGHIMANLLQMVRHLHVRIKGYEMKIVFQQMLNNMQKHGRASPRKIRVSKRLNIIL